MSITRFLKSDNIINGILLGLVIPLLTALIVIPAGRLAMSVSENLSFFDSALFLLCLIPNLLLMRYYLVRAKLEKTGKSILGVTVILILLFFIFVHGHPFNLPF